jgi:hypothetical protein
MSLASNIESIYIRAESSSSDIFTLPILSVFRDSKQFDCLGKVPISFCVIDKKYIEQVISLRLILTILVIVTLRLWSTSTDFIICNYLFVWANCCWIDVVDTASDEPGSRGCDIYDNM